MKLICLGGLLAIPAVALAQEPPPPYEPSAVIATQSLLPNMLSTAVGGNVDLRFDYTHFGGDASVTLFGFSLHGQYITPGGLGGYAAVPYGLASNDDTSESGIGNVEVGGLYAIRSSPNTDILLRGGVAIDTASDEGKFVVPATQISPRLNDAYTTGFGTTWGRAQAQFRHASGNLRIGASGGIDVPISGDLKDADSFDGLLNLAASVGLEQPGFGVGVGLVFIQALGTNTDNDDNSITGFNATVDFPVGPMARVFGTLGIPDLDNAGDNGTDLWAIGAGVRLGMR